MNQTLEAYWPLFPELIVALGAMGLLMLGVVRPERDRDAEAIGWLAIAVLVAAGWLLLFQPAGSHTLFDGAFVVDGFARFMKVLTLVASAAALILSFDDLRRTSSLRFEYPVLVLLATAGMLMMISASDLISLYVGLELQSLSLYVIAAFQRDSVRSTEAGLKYFVLGGFSSAFFIYGIALTYAVAGTTKIDEMVTLVASQAREPNILLVLAMIMLIVGFAFKVSAVPFHMWAPDAYQGAPTLVTGFMSTAVKAAAFAAFARVFLSALEPLRGHWVPILSAIAGLTMILGTVVGVAQSNVKRMLAYSSIAHAGYLLVGLVAANAAGKTAILFYVVAYAVTNLGAFGVLAALSTHDRPHDDVRDFAGLGRERPGLSAVLTVFLLSLGGFPPTIGFVAKWAIFSSAVQANQIALAVLGVLTSVVSVFFYLRIVVMMYMAPERAPNHRPSVPKVALAGLLLALAAVFYFGLMPGSLLKMAADSAAGIH